MRREKWFLVGTFVALVMVSVLLFAMEQPKEVDEKQRKLPRGNGAVVNIWLDTNARLDVLKEHEAKYLFVDVGGTNPDGSLNGSEEQMQHFLDLVRKYERAEKHDFVVLPYSEVRSYNMDVTTESFKENMIQTYAELMRWGFDGLLVDIEPIRVGQRAEFVDLLDALRAGLPAGAVIAVYSGHVGNAQNNEWMVDLKTYGEIAQRVDIISIPAYDTDKTDAAEYQKYVVEQVKLMHAVQEKADYLFAIPTHRPYPEESAIALEAYQEGMEQYPNEKVLGVTLFAEWTAVQQDWENIEIYVQERAV